MRPSSTIGVQLAKRRTGLSARSNATISPAVSSDAAIPRNTGRGPT